jgi:hypothetical protein
MYHSHILSLLTKTATSMMKAKRRYFYAYSIQRGAMHEVRVTDARPDCDHIVVMSDSGVQQLADIATQLNKPGILTAAQ